MARSKLETYIRHYLGIPYHINIPPQDSENNALVGKGTWQEIYFEAKKLNPNFEKLPPVQKYNILKKHHLGIDCSGLAYHLLNRLYQSSHHQSIEPYLIGVSGKHGHTGVRKLSADYLTNSTNSTRIKAYDDIRPGDLIRINHGHHVIFVIKKTNHTIHYVHSSNRTKIRGVHLGTITITYPPKSLIHQSWSEKIPSLAPASLHRLKCLT
jgi:hypothetical protein